jgi:aspartate aminotransferase-like enzyme
VALYTTLQETSTGVGHDIEGISRAIAGRNTLLVVDGISGVAAVECRTDAWGIDVLVVGGQKGLMGPPGLAFLSISPRAWRQVESFSRRAFYFDLLAYRRGLTGPDTPFTPATPLVVALAESLRALRTVPMEEHWQRCRRLAAACRAGLQAIGMKLVARRPADGMTAAYLPAGIDGREFLALLYSRFGVRVSGGQGQLSGKILRIAHFGAIDEVDLLGAIAAIELALVEFRQIVKLGSGVGAASEVLAAARSATNQ